MKGILSVCVLFVFLPFSTLNARDLFTGTLEIRGGKPLLVRCDAVRNTYVLVDGNGASDIYLTLLPKLGVAPGRFVQATVIADPVIKGDTNFLVVDSIEGVRKGSCHLLDLLH